VARVPPPYVLVGHSLGGHIVRAFASRHPRDVVGVILVDARPEDLLTQLPASWLDRETAFAAAAAERLHSADEMVRSVRGVADMHCR
jgi:pimeloyl-ACP methyl ester carboxylesterase